MENYYGEGSHPNEHEELFESVGRTCTIRLHRSETAQLDFECLKEINKNPLLSDVVLVAENKEIPAHRLILALASTFFYQKLSENVSNRIEIENVSYQTLTAIISYIYNSEITITHENANDLLAASDIFNLSDLRNACSEFLEDSPSSSTGYTARRCPCLDFIGEANTGMLESPSEATHHNNCLELSYELVAERIRTNNLCSREEDVLDYIIKWIGHDFERRKVFIYDLMSSVRFSLISNEYLERKLEQEQWMLSDPSYYPFLDKTWRKHFLKAQKSGDNLRRTQHLVVAGSDGRGILNLEFHDFYKNTWEEGPKLFISHMDPRLTIQGHRLYYFGNSKLKFIDIDDFTQTTWPVQGYFLEKRNASIVALDNAVYVIGGEMFWEDILLNTADKFNTATKQWETIGNMCEARCLCGLGVLNGNIYCVGGLDCLYRSCNYAEYYSPQQNCWYSLPAMPTARISCGVIAFCNALWVVGGWIYYDTCQQNEETDDATRIVEAYDPDSRTWSTLPPMIVARSLPGLIEVNGLLYVIGGFNKTDKELTSVEVYEPNSRRWTMLPSSMKSGKCTIVAALVEKHEMQL